MNRIKTITAYVSNVNELLWNYIKNKAAYPNNAVLAVQKELKETVIENPADCRNCEFYDLRNFIRQDSTGTQEPNMLAIRNLAYRFYEKEA